VCSDVALDLIVFLCRDDARLERRESNHAAGLHGHTSGLEFGPVAAAFPALLTPEERAG
jgi:hypothetical protein